MEAAAAATTSKPRRLHNSTVKRLQAQHAHQLLLLQQEEEQTQLELTSQLCLADGICQQKVLYKVVVPLHKRWLQQPSPAAADGQMSAQCTQSQLAGPDLAALMGLVDSCNPIVSAILSATPKQVQEAAALTRDELIEIHRKLFMELLVLLELLSPDRYHGEHTGSLTTDTAAAGQAHGGGLGWQLGDLPGSCSTDGDAVQAEAQKLASATAEAEKHLADLIQESRVLGGLLVLHNPALMMELCCTNVATGQTCVPPLGHFHRAAARLGLTQEQLMQLRLMLQQYNRSMLLQLQEGLDLLELSQDNLLQTIALAAQTPARVPAEEEDPKHTFGSVRGQPAAVAVVKGSDSSQHRTGSSAKSSGEHVSSETAPGETQDESGEQEADFTTKDVADSLERHLDERMEIMQLMGFWVSNTLSSLQLAKFCAYSWPYYPLCSALAEASTWLQSTADFDNSADAADTRQYMEWRRRGMHAELEWLLRHGCGADRH